MNGTAASNYFDISSLYPTTFSLSLTLSYISLTLKLIFLSSQTLKPSNLSSLLALHPFPIPLTYTPSTLSLPPSFSLWAWLSLKSRRKFQFYFIAPVLSSPIRFSVKTDNNNNSFNFNKTLVITYNKHTYYDKNTLNLEWRKSSFLFSLL